MKLSKLLVFQFADTFLVAARNCFQEINFRNNTYTVVRAFRGL